jgi:hypothetical protein
LWLTGEHYSRGKPLSYHAGRLPRGVTWYADPAGANERCELRCAGFVVREGVNAVRPGIAAVTARLEAGTLRIEAGRCPNLLAEAQLCRYDAEEGKGEAPLNEHNHALDALRYLITSLDARHLARPRRRPAEDVPPDSSDASTPPLSRPARDAWLSFDNDILWTRLNP